MAAAVDDLSRVEERLAELWRKQSSGGVAVTRASKLNLIVVAAEGTAAREEAAELAERLSLIEPGRALLVCPTTAAAEPLRVHVSTHCRGTEGRQVYSEQIALTVRDDALDLVPTTVLQLLVLDMPVYTLWRRPKLEPRPLLEALCATSERLIVDACALASPLAQLADLAERPRLRLDDLCWARLEPWRETVAGLFDLPSLRPFLERISRLRVVAADRSSAAYLAGWLVTRLGWREPARGSSIRPDGGRVAIQLEVDPRAPAGPASLVEMDVSNDEAVICLVVERLRSNPEVVRLRVERSDACPLPHCLKLPVRDDGALLAGLLQRQEDDAVHRAALGSAARLTFP